MTTTMEKRKALGRGLESLLPGGPRIVAGIPEAPVLDAPAPVLVGPSAASLTEQPPRKASDGDILEIALDLIDENPYQTRGIFRESELRELADSIRVTGVIQPIVVRPGKDGRFTLIMGERRVRASRLAGKEKIAAVVRVVSDQQSAEMTIIENLQRADLNAMEQARAFARLSQEFGLTQEQIGLRTGCSRESVSNYMRLLKLPFEVQKMLLDGQLDFSMARVLLSLLDPSQVVKVAEKAIKERMSVVVLEDYVFQLNAPVEKIHEPKQARWIDPNVRAAQQELERILGVRVRIHDRKGKGRIMIEYGSLEDFDRVLEMLKREA